MLTANIIVYLIYVIVIIGGFLALGYHLVAGEEEET